MTTQQDDVTLGEVGRAVKRIEENIREMRAEFGVRFVTQDEFRPVARLVYGLTGLVLIAVFAALIKLVIS